jgi:cytochrome oxidase Cu insertion factor (SCO1/SenC/PrrC family)
MKTFWFHAIDDDAVRHARPKGNCRSKDRRSDFVSHDGNAKDFDHSVRKILREDVNVAEPKPTAVIFSEAGRVRKRGTMPLFSLTNQNGERILLDSFTGNLVLTFIFTRCPLLTLPTIRTTSRSLQTAIKTGSEPWAKRLLSITLDPDYDTPKFSDYADYHHADAQIWTLATGGGKEIESLTRVFGLSADRRRHDFARAGDRVDRQERQIDKIWRGNSWTPTEVDEIERHD